MIVPTLNDNYQTIVNRLKEAGISVDSASSVASALSLGVAEIVTNLAIQLEDLSRSTSLDTAVGIELDQIGKKYNVSRIQAEKASTINSGNSVIFKNSTGTTVTVPAGSLVYQPTKTPLFYRTLETLIIPSNGRASVNIEADRYGTEYNAAPFSISLHNLNIPGLEVYNPTSISNASDLESDESYRSRIYLALDNKIPGQKETIRQKLSSLPGIKEVKLFEYSGGAGTVDILLVGISNTIPVQSKIDAENYLSLYAPIGIKYSIIEPESVFVDVDCSLVLPSNLESSRSDISKLVAQYIKDYLSNLSLEDGTGTGQLIYSQLLESIMLGNPNIIDFSVDVSIEGIPIRFGSNYMPQLSEKLYPRKISVY